jgi:phenolic acid decarboxylase
MLKQNGKNSSKLEKYKIYVYDNFKFILYIRSMGMSETNAVGKITFQTM